MFSVSAVLSAQCRNKQSDKTGMQWKGRKAVVLGNSISDKAHVGTTECWWEILEPFMGMDIESCALNGSEFNGVLWQAERLVRDGDRDFDLLTIFAGTNDFNGNIELGEWFSERKKSVNRNDKIEEVMQRVPLMDGTTFRGRLNVLADYFKTHFPEKQIVFMTPLHKAFSQFSEDNIQPDESYSNLLGLYLEDYVRVIRELGNVWSFLVIDLNAVSGLYPMNEEYSRFFSDKSKDLLHPNAKGHERIAKTVACQLFCLPVF